MTKMKVRTRMKICIYEGRLAVVVRRFIKSGGIVFRGLLIRGDIVIN